jgi:hypothetical protein
VGPQAHRGVAIEVQKAGPGKAVEDGRGIPPGYGELR